MKTIDDIYNEIKELETKHLIKKVLIFRSPITIELEYRVAYFLDNAEASLWLSNIEKQYKNIPYAVYTF